MEVLALFYRSAEQHVRPMQWSVRVVSICRSCFCPFCGTCRGGSFLSIIVVFHTGVAFAGDGASYSGDSFFFRHCAMGARRPCGGRLHITFCFFFPGELLLC